MFTLQELLVDCDCPADVISLLYLLTVIFRSAYADYFTLVHFRLWRVSSVEFVAYVMVTTNLCRWIDQYVPA